MGHEQGSGDGPAFHLAGLRIELVLTEFPPHSTDPSGTVVKNLLPAGARSESALAVVDHRLIENLVSDDDVGIACGPIGDRVLVEFAHHFVNDCAPLADILRMLSMKASASDNVRHGHSSMLLDP
ncbi:hypothetical protein [Brevibacterium oceani]|uniref:hypothetical protein n=1 Tax=Brevibacterium oceani TaxID=358099 RepID=UPI001B33AB55|nr:hypothetical protein [Brevibacterium oceani]